MSGYCIEVLTHLREVLGGIATFASAGLGLSVFFMPVVDGESARNIRRVVVIAFVVALVCWFAWAFMPTAEVLEGGAK